MKFKDGIYYNGLIVIRIKINPQWVDSNFINKFINKLPLNNEIEYNYMIFYRSV